MKGVNGEIRTVGEHRFLVVGTGEKAFPSGRMRECVVCLTCENACANCMRMNLRAARMPPSR